MAASVSSKRPSLFFAFFFAGVFGTTRDRVVSAYRDSGISEKVSEQTSKIRLPEVRLPEREGGDAERPGDGGRDEAPTREARTAVTPSQEAPAEEARTQVLDTEDARLARLERLGELRDKGVLTDEEFAAEKARVLDRGDQPA